MKYSCCLFEPGADQWGSADDEEYVHAFSSLHHHHYESDLDAAEEAMLSSYAEKARITDGMSIFDVGCGWGSLCLYMAEVRTTMS